MLEAVFSKSAAGGLAYAKCRKDITSGGADSGDDIFCFSDDLSAGDISGSCLSENRREYLKKLCSISSDDMAWALKDLEKAESDLGRLAYLASAVEAVRIWYSGKPCEYCGMCWILAELGKRADPMPEIRLMFLPDQVEKGDVIYEYMGWGEVCPEEFSEFLPMEKTAGKAFITKAVMTWREAQEQNAPLRAFINGRLHGVPENFYDCFIEREIAGSETEFNEAALIGTVLGKYQLGIGDILVATRIEKMIERGRLSPVSKPEPGKTSYRRILRKNDNKK